MGGDSAYGVMLSDLVEGVLAEAESPVRAAAFIAEGVRSLVGVAGVHVFDCPEGSGAPAHRLLASCPARRGALAGAVAAEAAAIAHGLASAALAAPGDGSPLGRLLDRAGLGTCLLVPLVHAGTHMGFLLAEGLQDLANIRGLFAALDRLSGVLALVMRNAQARERLEEAVAIRTADLAARTADLAARNAALEGALREKDLLVQEVHHRVKNNLQVVVSLLSLQSSKTADAAARDALVRSMERVRSMALVHERIYRSDDLASVDMGDYLRELAAGIAAGGGAAVAVECPPRAALGIVQAVPCGLVASELISNCAKHGGRGGRPRVAVAFRVEGGRAALSVEDDGPGLPPDFADRRARSLGLTIVEQLAAQLGGGLRVASGGGPLGGARFELDFPVEAWK